MVREENVFFIFFITETHVTIEKGVGIDPDLFLTVLFLFADHTL